MQLSREGKVLYVDDDPAMFRLFGYLAELSDTPTVGFVDTRTTVECIQNLADDELIAAVFSDGLHGGWRQVMAAAHEAGIPTIVMSIDYELRHPVEAAGGQFLKKGDLDIKTIPATLAQLYPDQTNQ